MLWIILESGVREVGFDSNIYFQSLLEGWKNNCYFKCVPIRTHKQKQGYTHLKSDKQTCAACCMQSSVLTNFLNTACSLEVPLRTVLGSAYRETDKI